MADDRDFPYDWSNPQDKQSNLQEYGCKAVICACKRDSEDPKKCALSFVISDTPPQSPDLEREARELVDKFAVELRGAYVDDTSAERLAVIHCELMIDKLTELLKSELHNDFGIMAERGKYTQLIEQINKL